MSHPPRPAPRSPLRRLRHRVLRGAGVVLATAGLVGTSAVAAEGANPATPGNFTGYGFDQCLAPTQSQMDAWLTSSPYWAVGIYISGDSRYCRSQPNLTPTWVRTQLARGWRLLPITLGPQASCNPRYPRWGNDETIDPSSARRYRAARRQGRAEADKTVGVATRLGIVRGSTLWYDLESYNIANTACRESALSFTSAWTKRLHRLGYVSGVYSSASTGMKALDDVRVNRPGAYTLPDRIWIADWDGEANTSSTYIRNGGWRPGGRMKQYRGGHPETYGGVTINIDNNWLDLGRGSRAGREPEHCGGVRLSYRSYPTVSSGDSGRRVSALQCLLVERGYLAGVSGVYDARTVDAVAELRDRRRIRAGGGAGPRVWTSLLSAGRSRLVKYGAASERVRRLQRALNAALDEGLVVTGVFERDTTTAVKRYQSRRGVPATGVVTRSLWRQLKHGKL